VAVFSAIVGALVLVAGMYSRRAGLKGKKISKI